MLNKNQSKKRNYLKYYAIIPALVAFVFLFQIKTIAQEKERKEVQEVTQKTDPIYLLKIQKNTTDQELKEITAKLKKDHNIDIEVSNVKRNTKNELTAISVDIRKGTEDAQALYVDGDKPIHNCGIVVSLEPNGSKKVGIYTDDEMEKSMASTNRIVEIRETKNANGVASPTPPTPPIPPVFPGGPMPQAPPVNMSKMPKPPVAPANIKDKVAMAKFDKEIAEFDKKMEAFEPDMSAYEKQVEEIMSQREATYEKEMQKYEVAMEKFNSEMEKFNQDIEQKYGKDSKEYKVNMKQYELDMRRHDIDMKQLEKAMKQHEKDMKLYEKELKRKERESKRS